MSARRAARAAGITVAEAGGPPAELRRAGAPLWSDAARFAAWMERHGWERNLPSRDRIGEEASPEQRRQAAAAAWAQENDVTGFGGFPDWSRLREMGLIK